MQLELFGSSGPTTDTLEDPCPKLGALGGPPHTVVGKPVREIRGRLKARCRYCSRSIDLGAA